MPRSFCICIGLVGLFIAPNNCPSIEILHAIEFNRDIRPILSDKCFSCHGPDASHRKAELRLDISKGAQADLGGYAAVVPGEPEKSELINRIHSSQSEEQMPPLKSGKQLTPIEKQLLHDWIIQGAAYEKHWAYIELKKPPVPKVKKLSWTNGAIDFFIMERMERENIVPSPEADASTLARRLHFDLTGLPPSKNLAKRLLKSPDIYPVIVDELLGSPMFGERLASYWLDLVRYADTVGYHGDQDHPITPYRDWVIKAFNDNMPFDRFTASQIAGDLLPESTVNDKIASGYNRLLQTSHEGGVQQKEYLAKYSADRVRNVSNVWLGATMGCSECHDHKYDPFSQRDFYSMAAFFADVDDSQTFRGSNTLPTTREPEMKVMSPLDPIGNLTRTMITGRVEPRNIRVLSRGNWMDKSGEIVSPSTPHFLKPIKKDGRATRLDLANWLIGSGNHLTARVFVNRLWYLFFGNGIYRSLDDNGSQGEWPDHPELLDWLAVEFIENGWDIKNIVRQIVMSRIYRQSSIVNPSLLERDPVNRLVSRQGRFRFPAETIRDNALAIGGLINSKMGGAVSRPYQPSGYYSPLNFPKRTYVSDKNQDQYRRGIYIHWQRQFLHPMFRAFDAPTREECTAMRTVSNTPIAALTLMNDPSYVEAARGFAVRILSEGGDTQRDRLIWAWQTALCRDPATEELAVMSKFAEDVLNRYKNDTKAAGELLNVGISKLPENILEYEAAGWTNIALAILNLSEVITRN